LSIESVEAVTQTDIAEYPVRRGKVRDIYDLGDEILLIATDRISAYDVVLLSPIPGKGAMLTQISKFWFDFLGGSVKHHLIEVIQDKAPAGLEHHLPQLKARTMRCHKTEVIPIEFVVRGYIAGSGWVDYQKTGSVCGIKLDDGLRQCDQLPEPIFTPATKADVGHDENISFEKACDAVGSDCLTELRDRSIEIYLRASKHARERGIIIADTKLEWGIRDGDYWLIDEVLTPDSSRFWPADKYEPGRDQDSFDKQYVRNFLTGLVKEGKWDKTPPGPELPDEIIAGTASRYREALEKLTG
jgi:phosphoribosylaminoimidazole-succinocarboxamide synthase